MSLNNSSVSIQISTSVPLGTSGSLGNASISSSLATNYTSGVTTGSVDIAYAGGYTVTTSPTSIDLNAGTITQLNGAIASFVTVNTIRVEHKGTTGTITVGGGSNPILNVAAVLNPGAVLLIHDPGTGLVVTPSTGDLLKLVASTGSQAVDVLILGRSA